MAEKEGKIKIISCVVCRKEYNKYTRPWGQYRNTCSEECQEVQKKKMEARRKVAIDIEKEKIKNWLIISLFTGVIGAIFGVVGGFLGVLLGFVIGFFAPILLLIICGMFQ
ncbi:MAG: hypothetical protein JSV62_08620 [Promethearchaeota archaeon]|nr:MAG: hypothetical protein JSV62_08620 [Candidatus Lokiarchaeota archaeon]